MAYAEKYRLDFGDMESNTWRISIYKDGYVGSIVDIKGQALPLEINWEGAELMKPIRSSVATLNLVSETDIQFSEFFTAIETDFLLIIKKNGATWWSGMYIPENYSEPYIDFPYRVKMRFSDGLAYLKKGVMTEVDANNLKHRPVMQLISDMLLIMPSDLYKNIREVNSIYEDQMPTTARGALEHIAVNTFSYLTYNETQNITQGKSTYEILEILLHTFGCTMYQWNNKWYIWRIDESTDTSVPYHEYTTFPHAYVSSGTINIDLTITNKDTGNPNQIIWTEKTPELGITDVYGAITGKYNYRTDKRNNFNLLPPNQPISLTPGEAASRNHSANWTESASLLAITSECFWWLGAPAHQLKMYIYDDVLINTKNINTNYSITGKQTAGSSYTYNELLINADDKIVMRFYNQLWLRVNRLLANNYFTNSDKVNGHIAFKLQMGSYYLSRANDGTLSWSLTDQIVALPFLWKNSTITDASTVVSTGNFDAEWTDFISNPRELLLPVLPLAGNYNMTFILYVPSIYAKGNPDAILIRGFEEFIIEMELQPGSATAGTVFIYRNELSPNKKTEYAIDLFHSDGIHKADLNTLLIKDGVNYYLPADWYNIATPATKYSHAKTFHLIPLSKQLSEYRDTIRGTLYSNVLNFYNMLNETGKSYDRGNRYFIKSMNYNVKNNEFVCDIEKISENAIISLTEIEDGLIESVATTNANPSLPFGTFTATITNLGGMGSYTNVSVTNPTKIRIDYINNNTETGMRDAVSYP